VSPGKGPLMNEDYKPVPTAVVAEAEKLDPAAMQTLAGMLNLTPYEVRQRLAGNRPRMFCVEPGAKEAAHSRDAIRASGARAFTIKVESLLGRPPAITADEVTENAGLLTFKGEGQSISLRDPDVDLILVGRRETRVHSASSKRNSIKVAAANLSAPGLGHLVRNKKSKSTETTRERFALLWKKGVYRPAVALRENDLDYSFLENQMAPSAIRNWPLALQWLENHLPTATTDDRLVKAKLTMERGGIDQSKTRIGVVKTVTETEEMDNTNAIQRAALCIALMMRGAWRQP